MEKRVILAIALSMLVLLTWSALVPKPQQIENKAVTSITPDSAISSAPLPVVVAEPKSPTLPAKLSTLELTKFDLVFNETAGAIQEVVFRDYQLAKFLLQQGFLIGDPGWKFERASSGPGATVFKYEDETKKIIKRFNYVTSNYDIWLEVEIQNLSTLPMAWDFPVILGRLNFAGDQNEARFQDVTLSTDERAMYLNARKDSLISNVRTLALRNRYFCAIIEPESKIAYSAQVARISPQESEIRLKPQGITVMPGQVFVQKFHIYLGPQELRVINAIQPNWSLVVHFGTFNFISHLLLQLLGLIFKITHNWGAAIIILSLAVYFLLYPLSLKQMRSMKEMQALQPHIEELRQKHKDSPQKLNKEIMELYREHKVNPFGGCLPLILQIPIFFALYQALMRTVSLKGAHFLWIKDLASPDKLFTLPNALPILGNEINILPLVMSAIMFLQQKISLASGSGAAQEQQKMMLVLFPVMFAFIFYRMPSGLVLYWLMNSALMFLFQLRVSRSK